MAATRKRTRSTIALAAAVVAALLWALLVPTAATAGAASADGPQASVTDEVLAGVADGESAFVIANLAAPTGAPEAVASTAQSVLDGLPEGSFQGEANAQALPFVTVRVDAEALEALRSDPAVTDVVLNHINTPSLVNSVPAIGADVARAAGLDGAGRAVAIIDGGVQWYHPFFANPSGGTRVVSESCFSGAGGSYPDNAFPLCPNPDLYTQTGLGASNPCNGLSGDIYPFPCGHGTHVAGIVAGGNAANNGTSVPRWGVAPKASILASNVFSLICPGSITITGDCTEDWVYGAFDSDIALALDWVNGLDPHHHVAAVNLSLGGSATYSTACDAQTIVDGPINTLKANGVPTVVASGNGGVKSGISSPACVANAISVGSWDPGTNAASGFSNSAPILDLLAPGDRNNGQGIVSSVPTVTPPYSGYGASKGTSMAAPHVAGAFALLPDVNSGEDVDWLLGRLTSTGTPVVDTNGVSTPVLDVDEALRTPAQVQMGSPQGAPYPGSTLTTQVGASGYPTPVITYQWFRCPSWSSGPGSPPGDCTAIVGETTSSHLITVADIGSHLALRATATNGVGSPDSAYQTSSQVPALPAQPAIPTTVAGYESLTVSWAPAWPDGLPITGYQLVMRPYTSGAATTTLDLAAGTTSHVFTGLDPGALYGFSVAQRNVNGLGPASAEGVGYTHGLPTAPRTVTAVAGDEAAQVSWEPPTFSGGVALTGYQVTASPGGSTCSAAPPVSTCKVEGLANDTAYTFTVTAQNTYGTGPASAASLPVTPISSYRSLVPARLTDTRLGAVTIDGLEAGQGAILPGQTRDVTVVGRGGVPESGVGAVALNVTVAGSSSGGYLTVYPKGVATPNASNINFTAGQVIANMAIVQVGADGKITIKNPSGSTPVIVDVVGYFPTAAEFTSMVPARLMDTRSPASGGATIDGQQLAQGPILPGQTRNVKATDRAGIPASGVGAVALNVTAVSPGGAGWLTVYPAGVATPNASNLNFVTGQTIANMVVVKVGTNGEVAIANPYGSTPVIVDIVGWFPADGGVSSLVPARLMDTRSLPAGQTVDGLFQGAGAIPPGQTRNVTVVGRGGVPEVGVGSVVVNVTVAGSSSAGYLTVYPTGVSTPNASNLNFNASQVIPNMAIVKVGANGQITVSNPFGYTPVIVDVVGWFP